MASPPYVIDETKPAASDLITQYPGVEQTFRDVVESWLTGLSDPTTGLLKPTAFPTTPITGLQALTTFIIEAAAAADATLVWRDDADVKQGQMGWVRSTDLISLTAYQDDGTTPRTVVTFGGDAAVVNVATGALQVAGNAVVDVTSAVATAITGTGALNAGSITSGFGSINIGSDALTAGATSVASLTSAGALSATTISGATGTFTGAIAGSTTITATGNLQGATVISTDKIFANSATGTMIFRPVGAASSSHQMTLTNLGVLSVDGNLTYSSDARLKKHVKPLSKLWALSMVDEVDGVSFVRKGSRGKNIGFIAQDIMEWAPELVERREDGMLTVAYPNLVAVLWQAVKQLKHEVEALSSKPGSGVGEYQP